MKGDILGAVDIGSNAIRLLINNVDSSNNSKDFKKTAFLRVPIRLGEDVFSNGMIGDIKKQLLCEAFMGFSHIMKAYNVAQFRACATSAMREAKNGEEVVAFIKKASGINIEIIGGQEEAEIIFEAGGLGKSMDKDTNYLYMDVGGGSTEFVVYCNGTKMTSKSFKMGTVRMLANAVKEDEREKMKDWLKNIYEKYKPLSIIASGGNINKVHKLLGKRENEYINYPELKVLYNSLSKMSFEERIINYKLKTYRADVIVPAMSIFIDVCKTCNIKEIYVPKVGLADGIIHHMYYSQRK